ncbi:hypothetical protein B4U79_14638, partial [Dinothrombium tinctorium]
MANSITLLDTFLKMGANAIEIDIKFEKDGIPFFVYHGVPCDCFRWCHSSEILTRYLDIARIYSTPGDPRFVNSFVLLMFDLKSSTIQENLKFMAGKILADKIIRHIFSDGQITSQLYLQIGIQELEDEDVLHGFMHELQIRNLNHIQDRIGWEITGFAPLSKIEKFWNSFRSLHNIWQGDGITNCLVAFRSTQRLKEAIRGRDFCYIRPNAKCVQKVYHWTIDSKYLMRISLRQNVDGIITNYPNTIISLLSEPEFKSKFRLADANDYPWSSF